MSDQLCAVDSTSLTVAAGGSKGSSYLYLFAASPHVGNYSACLTRFDASGEPHMESIIPALEPPANARMLRSGGGGGAGEWNSQATIRTSASLDDVVAHYDRQLVQNGWTQQKHLSSDDIVVNTYVVKDKDNRTWDVMLIGTAAQPDAPRYLVIRAQRETPE